MDFIFFFSFFLSFLGKLNFQRRHSVQNMYVIAFSDCLLISSYYFTWNKMKARAPHTAHTQSVGFALCQTTICQFQQNLQQPDFCQWWNLIPLKWGGNILTQTLNCVDVWCMATPSCWWMPFALNEEKKQQQRNQNNKLAH